MENITLGYVATTAAFIVGLGLSYTQIRKWTIQAIKQILKDELDAIRSELSVLRAEIKKEDKEKTKNFLVSRLADIERGQELSGLERQRFYEQYDHYLKDLDGNSYVKTAVDRCEQTGKIWR